jgi:hypothetical protein
MLLALPFLGRVGVWTGILLLVLVGLQLPQGLTHVGGHLPAWFGFALVLAAFPAGLGAAGEVLPDGRPRIRPMVEFTGAAVVIALVARRCVRFQPGSSSETPNST